MNAIRGLVTRPTKMVLVVRADLRLSKGKTGSQCAHAAVMCFAKAHEESRDLCRVWLGQGQPKIVLKVETLDELNDLKRQVVDAGVLHGTVYDAGRTQIPAGTLTVLGIGPDYSDKIDPLVNHLKLL